LLERFAVAVDEIALKRLGVQLGDNATLNGKTVKVRAVLTGYADINQATVVMSRDSMRLLGMNQTSATGRTGPLMVSLKDPSKAQLVRDQLNAQAGGAYRAWTRPELAEANEKALMSEQIKIGRAHV